MALPVHGGGGLRVAAVTLVSIVAAVAVVVAGLGALADAVLLAAAAAAAVALVAAAVLRFEWFLLSLIVLRSSLDLTKTSFSSPGNVADGIGALMIVTCIVWLWLNRESRARADGLALDSGPAGPPTPGDRGLMTGRRATVGVPSMLTTGIAAFVVSAFISVMVSSDPATSLAEAARLLAGGLMYFTVKRLLELGMPIAHVVMALIASAVVPLAAPIVGEPVGLRVTHVKDGLEALRSTFFLSNNFAHYLVLVLLLVLATIRYFGGWQRWVAVVVVATGTYELALTSTRGAWIGLAAGVVVIGLLDNRLLGLIAIGAGAVAMAFIPVVSNRIGDLSSDPENPRTSSSLDWRFEHWEQIIPLRDDNPVTGIGAGMTTQLSEAKKAPHNDYVRALVETGYFGFIAYLALVVGFVSVAVRALRRSTGGLARGFTVGLVAVAFAFAVGSLAENLITGIAFLWYAMPLAACADWMASARPASGVMPERTSATRR